MKKKKFIAIILTAIMSASAFSGCKSTTSAPTSAPSEKQEANATPSAEPAALAKASGKISISTWDLASSNYIKALVDEFKKVNSDIEIDIIDTPSADYTSKLGVDLNGGAAADVLMIKDADTMFSLSQKGQLEDLSSYINESNIDLGIYNGLADYFSFDGKQVGIPFRTDYYVLYYNKDLFDAANVPYPTNDMTWKQFEETAKQLTSGEGANKIYGAHLHTWQACVQNRVVQDGKNTIMGLDYNFMKDAYEMAIRMQDEDKSIQDYATLKTANIHYSGPFQSGTVAMLPMGTWFMATLIDKVKTGETTTNWAVASLPHPDGVPAGDTVGSTTPMAINNASQNKAAAWEFLSFCVGTEGANNIATAGQIPACVDESMLSTLTSIEGMPEGTTEALKVNNIVLDRPIVQYVNEVNQMLGEEHGLIMLGEISIDDGIAEIATRSAEIQKQ